MVKGGGSWNVLDAFIAGLLPALRRKIKSDLLTLYHRFVNAGGQSSASASTVTVAVSGSSPMSEVAATAASSASSAATAGSTPDDANKLATQWSQLVRHLMKEVMTFDRLLRDEYGYTENQEDGVAVVEGQPPKK